MKAGVILSAASALLLSSKFLTPRGLWVYTTESEVQTFPPSPTPPSTAASKELLSEGPAL